MTQRMIEITSPAFIPEERLTPGGSLSDCFDAERPLALEVGCGIGDFIVQLARLRPQLNFLAADIYNKGCHKTCRKVDAAGLGNVRVVRLEARYLLSRYIAEESLAAIYINCPDPWPKKRHRKRRLVDREFLQAALCYLRPGGDLFFSSDFTDYAEEVAADLAALPGFRNCLQAPTVPNLPGYPLSKYMRRFLDEGKGVRFIHFRKEEDFRADLSLLPEIRQGFRVRWSLAGNG